MSSSHGDAAGGVRAAVLVARGVEGLGFDTLTMPAPAPGQLRIRAVCSLVSPGTELHYLDECAVTGRRLRLGYCSAGYVDAIGAGVDGFRPGERVIAMGWGHAVHGTVINVPWRLCVRMPDHVSFAHAVVANLGATAVHAVDRAQLGPQHDVLVIGAGLVGQLVAQCATAITRRVFVFDRSADRIAGVDALGVTALRGDDVAQALAAAPAGTRIRTVFVCLTGDATPALEQVIAALAEPGPGRAAIICVGRFTARLDFSVAMGNLDIRYAARCGAGYRDDDYVHGRTELEPPAGEDTVDRNLARALELVARGIIRPQAMAIEDVPFEQAPVAYARLRERGATLTTRLHYGGGEQS